MKKAEKGKKISSCSLLGEHNIFECHNRVINFCTFEVNRQRKLGNILNVPTEIDYFELKTHNYSWEFCF